MTLLSAALLLLLVIDPLGNVPFFLSGLKSVAPERRLKVVVREMLIALVVLIVFLFLGRHALSLLRISQPALTAAGGVILLLIALRMIFPTPATSMAEDIQGEPFIVPLAIPYVAGPSALATELLIMSREPTRWPTWLAALGIAWACTSVVLLSASVLSRYLGEKVLIAMERLMGMVLVTVAIEMLMGGIREFITNHP
jgi:multiple antibiotic resistance protein